MDGAWKESLKKIFKKILFLPPIPTLLISLPSYLFVIYVLSGGSVHPAVPYIAYMLSAYAFIITITGISGIARWMRKGFFCNPLVKWMLNITIVKKITRDVFFRTEVSVFQGLFINLIYSGIKLFSGIYYHSVWFIALAAYYIFLATMRIALIHYVKTHGRSGGDKAAAFRRYHLCGVILLLMNVALVGIIVLAVHKNSGI